MQVAEMRMLPSLSGVFRKDWIRNEYIRASIGGGGYEGQYKD